MGASQDGSPEQSICLMHNRAKGVRMAGRGRSHHAELLQPELLQSELLQPELCSLNLCSLNFCSLSFCSLSFCSLTCCNLSFYSLSFCSLRSCSLHSCNLGVCSLSFGSRPGWTNIQQTTHGLIGRGKLDLIVRLQVSKIGRVTGKEAQEEEHKIHVWQEQRSDLMLGWWR